MAEKSASRRWISRVLKSTYTVPPRAQTSWRMSPQGLPKKRFSASWAVLAMTTGSIPLSLYSSFRIRPISTEKAAEEDSPTPTGRVLRSSASKPPMLRPRSLKDAATPRIRAMGEPNSLGRTLNWFSCSSSRP